MAKRILNKSRAWHSAVMTVLFMATWVFTKSEFQLCAETQAIMSFIGYILIILGVFGRVFSSVFIGGFKNEKVIGDGIYEIVRNPLYTSSFLGVVGIGLQTRRLDLLLFIVAFFAIYYTYTVWKEEIYLTKKFGKKYLDYKKITPKWIPAFLRFKMPQEIKSRPKYIYRTMRDASWFFLFVPLAQLISYYQSTGDIMVYYVIPWPF